VIWSKPESSIINRVISGLTPTVRWKMN